MTDRPEERRCPCCGRNGFGTWRQEESYEDHVAACRRKRALKRQRKKARRGPRARGK